MFIGILELLPDTNNTKEYHTLYEFHPWHSAERIAPNQKDEQSVVTECSSLTISNLDLITEYGSVQEDGTKRERDVPAAWRVRSGGAYVQPLLQPGRTP